MLMLPISLCMRLLNHFIAASQSSRSRLRSARRLKLSCTHVSGDKLSQRFYGV